jgi:hypothetical protein
VDELRDKLQFGGYHHLVEAEFTKSPVRENRTPGSVRGLSGNWQSYRDQLFPELIEQLVTSWRLFLGEGTKLPRS